MSKKLRKAWDSGKLWIAHDDRLFLKLHTGGGNAMQFNEGEKLIEEIVQHFNLAEEAKQVNREELLRSLYCIAERDGKNTNWTALLAQVENRLTEDRKKLEELDNLTKSLTSIESERDRLKQLLLESEAVEQKTALILKSQTINLLQSKIEKLTKALDEIVNPIQHMQIRAKEEGAQLNGMMAVQLASDANYLKQIADRALRENYENNESTLQQ